ncbi:MAG: rSAM-modified peptide [bacterium]|nr:rSAM-modified peptide [bacterium]
MKTNKFNKRLTLNKTTIADLSHIEMRTVLGGEDCPVESDGGMPGPCKDITIAKPSALTCDPNYPTTSNL